MANMTYGTAEFYAECFADFLADVDHADPGTVDNIIKGFLMSVEDWFNYHEQQANAYAQLRQRVREALAM